MTAITWLVPAWIVKEFRVLLPAWLVALTVLWIMGVAGEPPEPQIAIVVVASIIIGAISVGHEFAYRALESVFALPVSRLRLYVTKTAAAILLLLLLSLYVLWLPGRENIRLVILLAGLPGLFVAQWLTLRSRNELAGVVFTLALPVAIYFGVNVITTVLFDTTVPPTSETIELRWALFSRMLGGVCLAAAASSWWVFRRLQAVDRRSDELSLPEWLPWPRTRSGATASGRHPFVLLIGKELRLQQASFAVAAIYLLGCLAMIIARRSAESYVGPGLFDLTFPYAALFALIAGSLASAEERQLGTLGWQTLLPVPAGHQWAIKIAVVTGLTLVLGVGLPALILVVGGPVAVRGWLPIVLSSLAGVAAATYVSSVSTGGLRALLACLGLTIPLWLAVQLLVAIESGLRAAGVMLIAPRYRSMSPDERLWLMELTGLVVGGAILTASGLLFRFARDNHVSADRDWNQMARHLGILLLLALVATATVAGIDAVLSAAAAPAVPDARVRSLLNSS